MKPLFHHRCPVLLRRSLAIGNSAARALRAVLFVATALTAVLADAQIFSNGINDSNPSASNPFTAGQVVAANLTVTGIGRGPGINANAGGDRYNATAWTTAAALDANDYFTWTLTPNAGFKIDLTSLTGNTQRSNTGPTVMALRSSLDNYATDLGTTNPGTGATAFNFNLGSAAFDAVTTSITFRLYGWSAGGASGTASVNDFAFNGSVVQLPAITASVTTLPAFSTQLGTPSAAQTFTTSGGGLTAPLVIAAPAGFEVRENNVGSYGSSVSFTPSSGSVATKTIQVRLSGASTGNFAGNVTCTSTGATTKNIAVTGTVINVNTGIGFSASSATLQQNAGGTNLTLQINNPSGSAATNIQVALTSGSAAAVGDFTTQNITFPAGSSTSINVPVTITDNGIWDAGSTIVFTLQNISGGQGTPTIGPNSTFTLTLQEYLPLTLVLNEIDYAMPGEGAEFIELKNTGNAGLDLHDFKIDLVYEDGGPQSYDQIVLPSFVLQPGMYYVVCGDPANVANCDLTASLPTDFIAGGLTAAVGLRSPASTIVDAVSYEGNTGGGFTEGSSTLADPADIDGVSLARIPDGQDTQQNNNDLRTSCPTPGAANKAAGTACDDGDPNTLVDVILADCSCAGTPAPTVDCEGVEGGPALPGTACTDDNAETLNDTWSVECVCTGTPVVRDCLGVIDGPAMPGTACDDSNIYTENDTWSNACACSGTLVPTPPTVVTGSASSITATTAVLNATVTAEGSSALTAHAFEYSTINGFVQGTGTPVEASAIVDGAFTGALSGLTPNTTYYFNASAANTEGSSTGTQMSFMTQALTAPVAIAADPVGADTFTANWEAVEGATGYRLDVSTSPTFGTMTLATDLLISEYVEGSSNNKYLEIFNGTGAAVDLGGYRLRLYSNGGTTITNDAALSGTLANGATIVYKNSAASVYGGAATVNGAVNYNGDDAIALFKVSSGANVDIFGRIGEDPGTAWTGGGLSTLDRTLVRKPTVSGGVTTNPTAGFPTLTTEWNGAATDAVGDLGQHTFISFVPNMLPGYNDLAVAGLSQEVTGLTPGTTYYYRVRAINGAQTTANSNVITVHTGVLDCENVLNGPALPGTACDDANANTGNDVYGPDCVCVGQPLDCLGVPGGTATIGSACDDADASTGNDVYGSDCICAGQVIDCLGVAGGTAIIGSTCDDADASTGNDVYGADCVCAGQLNDCLGAPGGSAVIGSACDDGDINTGNDVYGTDCICSGTALAATTGPSSSQTPYLKPQGAGNTTTSILTVGDAVGGYKMVGIPDGLGAFDNGNNTFTLLINHEISSGGVVRAHGSNGAFVSKWIINKNDLSVVSGQDLIQSVQLWNGTGFTAGTTMFSRFCSADLPAVSAFYNAGTGKGTQERIFMNGEESGNEGRGLAHIVTGAEAGVTYQLPRLGRFSWENAVANPASGDKTVVFGTDDSTPGQVYVYVGTKQSTGLDIEKAGLNNGILYGVAVNGLATEVNESFPAAGTPFTLASLGDVSNLTGAEINTNSNAAGITNFLRPEDASWDPTNPSDLYFATTNALTSPSRLWKLHFTDILHPELGGTITAVLEGNEGQKMMDNITVDQLGRTYIVEDVGNNVHIGRMLQYNNITDALTTVAYCDSSRFLVGGADFLTQDEEASGVIDMQAILGKGKYLVDVQAHYATTTELVEGGQLLQFATSDTIAPCVPAAITSITPTTTLCGADTLELMAAASGTLPLTYSWTGTGNFLFGSSSASALVTDAATGPYTLMVTNACGSVDSSVAVTAYPLVTYYADVDGDGLGDAGADSTSCTQPVGYVTDNTDLCPALSGTVGSTCDDGNADTGNDVITSDCTCAGQPIDCLGTPGGTALPGTTCDDGNANTTADVYGNDCVCAGTPVTGCTGNQMVVTIRTDANGGQTTWQVQDAFAFTVASGGPYTTQNNATIHETVCLPTTFGNCYSFYLFDSFGDGLCCANGNGYWELRSTGGALLLRDNFASTPDGHQSPAVTPVAPGYVLGHQFCLPAGPSSIMPDECGIFTNTLQSKVYCQAIPGAAQYQFEFSDPDAGFRRLIALPRNWVKFSEMQTSPLVPGTTYFARVRVDQNAIGFSDDHFGAGCEMAISTNVGCTSLIDEPNTPTHSCGTTRHFNTSEKVWAYPVVGATQYRFRFSNPGEGFVRNIERPSYVCPLGWVTSPLQAGVTYDVQVDVLVNTVWSGFCGPTCQLTILAPGQSRPGTRMTEVANDQVDMWPNPVGDGRVHLLVNGLTEEQQHISVDIFDLFGKKVLAQQSENSGEVFNTVLQVPSTVAKGVYLVNITINGRTTVQRLSVQ